MTNDEVKKLYVSGWNGDEAPSDSTDKWYTMATTDAWEIWAAGNSDQEDDEHQADFPLGLEKRYEMFMEWEYPDMG